MKKLLLVFILLVAVVGLYLFYYPSYKISAARKTYDSKDLNVVFVLMDTLRADHLPFYGYHKNTASFLSSLAARSAVFDRAISASSWTVPSVSSIFTSKTPSEHGVFMGFFATQKLQEKNQQVMLNRLPEGVETIAEYFQANGYQTVGVTDNWNISDKLGFERGFSYFQNFSYKTADVVNPKVDEFLSQIDKDKKYFLYLHYMDPHSPYRKRDKWYEEPPNADHRKRTVARYDSSIGYVDSKFQELYEKHGWAENALIVVVSDHGEAFWEHGVKGHGKTLYREETHIPLLIIHPKVKTPSRVSEPVGQIDLLPTLADILELPKREQWSGKSFFNLLAGVSDATRHTLSELLFLPEYMQPQYQG